MNKQTEALKMAIEALDTLMMEKGSIYQQALNACKEALEQPAQEPVAEVDFRLEYDCALMVDRSKVTNGQKLYTHPAPSWQGLNYDETETVWKANYIGEYKISMNRFARAIEQALKEKNER